MGKQSTRKNKNIYQLCREEQGLTREKASEKMTGVSASRIEKIEYDLQDPTPYDVIQMADCYKRPICVITTVLTVVPSEHAMYRKLKLQNYPISSLKPLPALMTSILLPTV